MAIDQTVDPIAYLEEAMKPTPRTTDFVPFFFKVSDGQKALIRPLLNMNEYVEVFKHEYFDNTAKTWKYRNICPADFPCQICAEVAQLPETTKEEKKLKRACSRARRFVLPVYLHMVVTMKTGEYVTYKQDDKDIPVSGPRLLEMKPEYSTILHDLLKAYQHPAGGHDITKYDFKIECSLGSDGFPKYDVTPYEASAKYAFEAPESYLSKASVLDLYWEACPAKIVGRENTPAATPASSSNGAIKTAPDF